jgi:hypothetical protein
MTQDPTVVQVRFCPGCGTALDAPRGFVHEYWVGTDRNFQCWCPDCLLNCTVMLSLRVTSHEPEH